MVKIFKLNYARAQGKESQRESLRAAAYYVMGRSSLLYTVAPRMLELNTLGQLCLWQRF